MQTDRRIRRSVLLIDAIIRVWVTREFRESVEEVVEIVKRAQDRQIPMHISTSVGNDILRK